MSSITADPSRLAVIPYPEGASIEILLAGFVARLQAQGVQVRGLLQRSSREPNGRPRMELVDIESGGVTLISQNLGADSKACCVDVTGMASAAVTLRHALSQPTELLVINKFSGLEAKGGGLRAEFLDAVAAEIPLVTGLSLRHREAFLAMTEGFGCFLPAEETALIAWWQRIKASAPPPRDLPVG